jgi:hypothetical protein
MKATNIKKMVALGVGLTMVGATVFGASAAMLADYPAPFIVGGVPASNLAIVVGDAADGSDVVGAVDVIQGLQTSAVVKTASGGIPSAQGVTVEGDAVEIGSTSDLLEINENIGNVREALTEVDLLMLKGGQIVTDEGSTEYNQYLRFPTETQATGTANPSAAVVFAKDERDRVGHYLYWDSGDVLFQWELEFEEGLESEVTGTDLVDLEDEDLFVLGQPFVVVDTDLLSDNTTLTLDLMGGAVSAILGENDKETYVVDGKEYEVEVLVISETAASGEGSVKFRINGEITDELTDGETDVLADGTQVGIRDILATGKDIQKSIVQFYIGAYKISFHDTSVSSACGYNPAGAEVNEETIEDSAVCLRGAVTNVGEFEISSLKYNLTADAVLGDIYIAPGTGVREQLDEPEGMLTPFWDIKYEGLMDTGVTIVRLDAAGDDEYGLEFTNQEGIFYDVPYLTNEGGTFKWGDADDELWFTESENYTISDDDFFLVSNCRNGADVTNIRLSPYKDGVDDNTCFSHVLRYDSIDTSNRIVTFTDLGVGTREVSYDGTTGLANLIVGGTTYVTYVQAPATAASTHNLSVDLNGDGTRTCGNESYIGIQGEGMIDLGYQLRDQNTTVCWVYPHIVNDTVNLTTLQLITLANEFDEAAADEIINVTVESRTSNEIGITVSEIGAMDATHGTFFGTSGSGLGLFDLEENEDLEQGISAYGVFVELFNPSTSDQAEDLTIEYPLSQRGARVFVTGGVVKTSTVSAGGAEKVQPIQIGAAKLASEVADVTQFNAIVVGGPCANPIAAQLMGNPEPCWEAVPENKAILKLYEHTNGNVALLVAGRTALNTRQASRVLAGMTGLAGVKAKEAEVSGTSLTDVTVKAI